MHNSKVLFIAGEQYGSLRSYSWSRGQRHFINCMAYETSSLYQNANVHNDYHRCLCLIFDDDDDDDYAAAAAAGDDDDGVCANGDNGVDGVDVYDYGVDGDVYDYCDGYDDLGVCDNDNNDAAAAVATTAGDDDDGVCANGDNGVDGVDVYDYGVDGDVYDYCGDYDDLGGCDNDNNDAAGGADDDEGVSGGGDDEGNRHNIPATTAAILDDDEAWRAKSARRDFFEYASKRFFISTFSRSRLSISSCRASIVSSNSLNKQNTKEVLTLFVPLREIAGKWLRRYFYSAQLNLSIVFMDKLKEARKLDGV